MAKISLIAAMDSHRVIGNQGKLPWDKWSTDLEFFKEMTMGHVVVMGRRTFETIGRPLPGRFNIVVTRNPLWSHPGVEVTNSFTSILVAADYLTRSTKSSKIFVIGGAELYKQALPHADEIILTKIRHAFVGDTLFPEIPADDWDVRMNGVFHEPGRFDYEHIVYERRDNHAHSYTLGEDVDPPAPLPKTMGDLQVKGDPLLIHAPYKPKRSIMDYAKFFTRKRNEQS